jgi:hypothetical protein
VNANISMQATSYPNLVHVCNPFSAPPNYFYQPENCPDNTIRIGDIPKVSNMFLSRPIKLQLFDFGPKNGRDFVRTKNIKKKIINYKIKIC